MSTIFTVDSYTNQDEYDCQSTYTDAIGAFDNIEAANQAAADTYLYRYLEYVECMEEDQPGFGDHFGVSLVGNDTFDVETFIRGVKATDVLDFFVENGEMIWPSEMGSCTQTFYVEVNELEVRPTFYLTDEQKRANSLEEYIDIYEFTPNEEELSRYIHHNLTTRWNGPEFVPNKSSGPGKHNIL